MPEIAGKLGCLRSCACGVQGYNQLYNEDVIPLGKPREKVVHQFENDNSLRCASGVDIYIPKFCGSSRNCLPN